MRYVLLARKLRYNKLMIYTKAVRALADSMSLNRPEVPNVLRQCADEIDALNEEVQRLKIWQSQMVEKAADKSLAGDRELADTCARLSNELDALEGQALSAPEREEYFAMKKKAAEYDTLREELATAQTDRFDELQYLRTENAELHRAYQRVCGEAEKVENERDTLRELVREVLEYKVKSWGKWCERAEKVLAD